MIIGHERQLHYLKKSFKNGTVPHALFFWGPDEIGKRTVAESFAASFICKKETFLGCGTCALCQPGSPVRLSHILFASRIKEEIEGTGQGIGIDVIREIQNRAYATSFSQKPKIILIEDVSAMSDEAWHSFLKILEEPPKNVFFIIIGQSRESVLPTIFSRTVSLRFSLVSQKTMLEYVGREYPDMSREKAHTLTRFAGGRPGRLLKSIENPAIMKDAQKKYSVVFSILTNPLHVSLQKIDEVMRRDESIDEYMEPMFVALRSMFFLGHHHESSQAVAIPEAAAKKFRSRYTLSDGVRLMNELFKIQRLMRETNANKRIAFESFIVGL